MDPTPATTDAPHPANPTGSSPAIPSSTPVSPAGRLPGWAVKASQFMVVTAVGVLIGIPIQCGVEKSGVLGPSISDLIEKQSQSLEDLQAKMDELRTVAQGSPEVLGKLDAMQVLLTQQERLANRSADELRELYSELERVKAESLKSGGFAGGADVWLGAGESVSIHSPANHFSFVRRVDSTRIYASSGGEPVHMAVGDSLDVNTAAGTYRVVYKQAQPRSDERIGFDVIPPAK